MSHLLAIVGEANGIGAQTLMVPAVEGAIVEASSHAEPIALAIEGDQRGKDDIDGRLEHDALAIKLRFGNAKLVATHRRVWLIIEKQQMPLAEGMQYRQTDGDLPLPAPLDDALSLQFAIAGQIEGHTFGMADQGVLGKLFDQSVRRLLLLFAGESTPGGAHLFTDELTL